MNLRRLAGYAVLTAAIVVPLTASPSSAEYFDEDPDDTDTAFDISAVRSSVSEGGWLVFRTLFYDVLEWRSGTEVRVFIDSRSGPSADYYLNAWVGGRGEDHCELRRGGVEQWPVDVNIRPQKVVCGLPKSLLRPTHEIRWSVRTLDFLRHEPVNDWAPSGFGDWYPHV